IAQIARSVPIPVIVVLPEINLVDWETRQPPVWLPDGGIARWHALYGQACMAVDQGDFARALAIAREMQELDAGLCPASWRLAFQAWNGLGDGEEARRAALAEVDAAAYPSLALLSAPQATTAARGLLREATRRHNFFAVDLREVFAEHTGSRLPDRR